MPASSLMSRVRVAAYHFLVNSFRAAFLIFSSVLRSSAFFFAGFAVFFAMGQKKGVFMN